MFIYYKKFTLVIFLVCILALVMSFVYGIVLDSGVLVDGSGTKSDFWNDQAFINENIDSFTVSTQINNFPNTVWTFTQFTWVTTSIVFIFFAFRIAWSDHPVKSRWLQWIFDQRILSSLAIYELTIVIVYWSSVLFQPVVWQNDTRDLSAIEIFDTVRTVIVHAVLPALVISFSLFNLVNTLSDCKFSIKQIAKMNIYPLVYSIYYLLISFTWYDPYPATNFHIPSEVIPSFSIWIVGMLGAMIFCVISAFVHNFIFAKMNAKYKLSNLNKK